LSYKPNNTHLPCPKCGSSDGYSIDDQGWGHCFVCSLNHKVDNKITSTAEDVFERDTETKNTSIPLSGLTNTFRSFRGISKETIQKFGVDVAGNPKASYEAKYPLYQGKKHVANKLRYAKTEDSKPFSIEGSLKDADMFGMHLFPAGSAKAITVTEGQDDCMAAFEMLGSKYPCVSIHSAGEAEKQARKHYEYLNSFDNIVLSFDRDTAGETAAKKFAGLFPIGKVKIFNHREYKDANEYLLANKAQAYSTQWWKAQPYRPDGLKLGSETLDDILNKPDHYTVQYPYESMNKMTYGLRLSEFVLLMADTGAGKTTFMKECAYKILMDPEVKEKGYGVGFLHLEEPIYDTALGLMSIHESKPYHLPDTPSTVEELKKAHGEIFGDDRAVLYDAFGSNEIEVILSKIRHMHALGCKYFFLDHLSILVSDQAGDERKDLDEISTKLKTLCMELNIAVVCVIHTNRTGQARGSAGPEKVANLHIHLLRDKEESDEWRRNVVKLVIKKNRFVGKTGPSSYLWYNPDTGRLAELDKDEIEQYEQGSSVEQW